MTLNYNVNEEDLFRWYQYSFRASPVPRAARKRHMLFWFAAYVSFASVVVLAFQTYTAA